MGCWPWLIRLSHRHHTLYSLPSVRQAQNGKSLSNSASARSIASRSGTEFSQSVWSGAMLARRATDRGDR